MDFQKNKTLLDKINALYKNISSDPRNVSSIEMDLMKSYIQQFYEAFLDLPTETSSKAPMPMAAPIEQKPTEPRITLRKPETTPPPPPLNPQPEPARPEPLKVERVPEPAPAPPPPPPVVVAPPIVVEVPPVVQVPPTPAPVELAVPKPVSIDPEIDELFAFKSATELSEKLGELPITDIKKAMGLNERITTQNDLFGGDAAAFDATVATLNQLRSYDEAKDYLVRNVAVKFNWASKDKKDKAKAFIKLVRRRY